MRWVKPSLWLYFEIDPDLLQTVSVFSALFATRSSVATALLCITSLAHRTYLVFFPLNLHLSAFNVSTLF